MAKRLIFDLSNDFVYQEQSPFVMRLLALLYDDSNISCVGDWVFVKMDDGSKFRIQVSPYESHFFSSTGNACGSILLTNADDTAEYKFVFDIKFWSGFKAGLKLFFREMVLCDYKYEPRYEYVRNNLLVEFIDRIEYIQKKQDHYDNDLALERLKGSLNNGTS